jgi:hypothetical protein
MIVAYVVAAMTVLLTHASAVPAAFLLIVDSAFSPVAATGGFAGAAVMAAIRFGVARGIFSNEAGLGTAGIAQAAGQSSSPVRSGLIGMMGTFNDTIIVCSMTGLAIVVSGAWDSGETALEVGIRRGGRRRDDQPAEPEAQLQRLEHVGTGLPQHVGAGDAEVRGTGLHVHRHVARLDHQELDRRVAGGDEQAAAGVVGRRYPCGAEPLDRRLVEPAFGERHPKPAHSGTSAIASRSRDTPTAGMGRPNRPIRSS